MSATSAATKYFFQPRSPSAPWPSRAPFSRRGRDAACAAILAASVFGPLLRGDNITLRPARENDAEHFVRWFADMAVTRFLARRANVTDTGAWGYGASRRSAKESGMTAGWERYYAPIGRKRRPDTRLRPFARAVLC